MVANATAALVVGRLSGIDRYVSLKALSDLGAVEGRGETTSLGPSDKPLLLVDESYNANIASMGAAMDVFAGIKPRGGNKVLVLGDMLELGAQSAELHQSLKDAVLGTGATRIFLVGASMEALGRALGETRVTAYSRYVDGLVDTVLSGLAYGDAVMVKGSKGVRLALLVDKIKERFGPAA